MKTSAMITMAAILAGSAWAATKTDSQRLAVCIEDRKHAGVADAVAKAALILLSAGVKLDWHSDLGFCHKQRDSIVVSFSESTPKAFHPGALAYAFPYEGVHIQVFYERIAGAEPELAPSLLAYVIVHEITHILQGVDRHSKSGIMKAVWTSSDYTLMKCGHLRFTALDVEMIHDGIAARAARNAGVAVVAAVAP
jgi:hypothetical protein